MSKNCSERSVLSTEKSDGLADVLLRKLAHWQGNSESDAGMLPMPSGLYCSEAILDVEIEKIFQKEWLCAGHISELGKQGDYTTLDIAGHPVIVLRDSDDDIRAYSNVCPHRSARLLDGTGNARVLVCPYHSWTYELNGNLRGAPRMDMEKLKKVCLNEINVEIWQGIIFINLDKSAEAIAPNLKQLSHSTERYKLSDMEVTFTVEDEIDCNWKVLVENFCESYHVFKVHRSTLEPDTPTSSVNVMSAGTAYNHHTLDILSDEAGDKKTNVCGVFPAMTMAIRNHSALWLSIQPINSKRLKYQVWIARDMQHESSTETSIKKQIEAVMAFMAEDKKIIAGVQQGLESGVGNQGPLNAMEATNWQFGHYYAKKLLA